MTPLLSELREPPVVGRFYMVPVVKSYPWHGRVRDWPVIGPLHEDAGIFDFPDHHYHVDIRFVGSRDASFMVRHVPEYLATWDDAKDLAFAASAIPLSYRGVPLPKGRPQLKRLQCRRIPATTPLLDAHTLRLSKSAERMRATHGDVAEPIRLKDGRMLCPHRKVDLSQFPQDAEGIVTCPVHGLRVRCGVAA